MANQRIKLIIYICIVLSGTVVLSGCSQYTVPGKGADMSMFKETAKLVTTNPGEESWPRGGSGGDIEIKERKPMAEFPANMVVIRVQEQGYKSYTSEGYGHGKFSVVFVRDIEKDEDFDRLNKLPS